MKNIESIKDVKDVKLTHYKGEVQLFNGDVAIVQYTSEVYCVFYTEKGHFVWNKTKDEVVKLSIDSYTKLILKLETAYKHHFG